MAQSMADYAALIQHVRTEHGCPGCPVIAFGGSYSGKLSAYLRLKYPTHVDIALAASAPIKLDSVGLVDPLRCGCRCAEAAEARVLRWCVELPVDHWRGGGRASAGTTRS